MNLDHYKRRCGDQGPEAGHDQVEWCEKKVSDRPLVYTLILNPSIQPSFSTIYMIDCQTLQITHTKNSHANAWLNTRGINVTLCKKEKLPYRQKSKKIVIKINKLSCTWNLLAEFFKVNGNCNLSDWLVDLKNHICKNSPKNKGNATKIVAVFFYFVNVIAIMVGIWLSM